MLRVLVRSAIGSGVALSEVPIGVQASRDSQFAREVLCRAKEDAVDGEVRFLWWISILSLSFKAEMQIELGRLFLPRGVFAASTACPLFRIGY